LRFTDLDLPTWGLLRYPHPPMRKPTTKHESSPKPQAALAQKLARHMAARHQISAGQRIGVAVSGGADSVALLRLLLELREHLGIVLSVAHFNHKLRGKVSDSDERFVAKLAAKHGLPFFAARENIAAKAKQQRANLEETARRSRYAFFDQLVSEGHVDRVAVAHTSDDQAETVLAHILRGTGIAGLGGIHPEAGAVFRPLLHFRRAELHAYLRSLKQPWREDATNRDTSRTRARIRYKLIPFLEKQFQPAVVEHLRQLAELAREDDASLEGLAALRVFLNAKEEKGGWRVAIRELIRTASTEAHTQNGPFEADDKRLGYHSEAISNRMIRVLVKKVKPRAGQLGAVHVDAILQLAQSPDSGKSLHLPGGVEVRRERDALLFRPAETRSTKEPTPSFANPVDLTSGQAELPLQEHSQALRFVVIDWPAEGRETSSTGAVLDRDKLVEPLVLRYWQPGDSMQPLGHQKRHKLSRLLNELGISRWQKVCLPVLLSGTQIAWCRGLPVAAAFAPGKTTRRGVAIVEVSF
jgi:tRNA(Ile)-lysidine synthase